MLAEVLALLQRETGEQWCGGIVEAQEKGEPVEPISECVHKPLSIKCFHGVQAEGPYKYSLKSTVGRVSNQALKKFESLPEGVSFTDCLVMATADEYATLDIFGLDKQFEDAGYRRLEPATRPFQG